MFIAAILAFLSALCINLNGEFGHFSKGDLLALASAACFGLHYVVLDFTSKKWKRRADVFADGVCNRRFCNRRPYLFSFRFHLIGRFRRRLGLDGGNRRFGHGVCLHRSDVRAKQRQPCLRKRDAVGRRYFRKHIQFGVRDDIFQLVDCRRHRFYGRRRGSDGRRAPEKTEANSSDTDTK